MKRLAFLLCGLFAAFSIGAAIAASPPVINRVWDWNISSTTAGLSMSYNNHDQNARVWFEVSTHGNMADAKRVAETTVTPREGGSQWHADLNGLLPGTVYYYRAFIRNYDGEVYSGIASFRTAAGTERRPPTVTFEEARNTGSGIQLGFGCDGKGLEGSCVARWSTSPNMSGARELSSIYLRPAPGGTYMHATFNNSSVPDNTRIYIQAEAKTANGTEKTAIREFLIRNKPI